MKIRFPWPNPKLSGNSRVDRRYITSERQQAKWIGYCLTREAQPSINIRGGSPLELHIVICPPDHRHRDDDNILTAFKSYRDGIFLALEINDRLVRRTIMDWGEVEKDGALYIELSVLDTRRERK